MGHMIYPARVFSTSYEQRYDDNMDSIATSIMTTAWIFVHWDDIGSYCSAGYGSKPYEHKYPMYAFVDQINITRINITKPLKCKLSRTIIIFTFLATSLATVPAPEGSLDSGLS